MVFRRVFACMEMDLYFSYRVGVRETHQSFPIPKQMLIQIAQQVGLSENRLTLCANDVEDTSTSVLLEASIAFSLYFP